MSSAGCSAGFAGTSAKPQRVGLELGVQKSSLERSRLGRAALEWGLPTTPPRGLDESDPRSETGNRLDDELRQTRQQTKLAYNGPTANRAD